MGYLTGISATFIISAKLDINTGPIMAYHGLWPIALCDRYVHRSNGTCEAAACAIAGLRCYLAKPQHVSSRSASSAENLQRRSLINGNSLNQGVCLLTLLFTATVHQRPSKMAPPRFVVENCQRQDVARRDFTLTS